MSVSGVLSNENQSDWFAVTLVANQAYEFTVTDGIAFIGTVSGLSGMWSGVSLGDGTVASSRYPFNTGNETTNIEYAYFVPTVGGTYYVDVDAANFPFNTVVPDNFTLNVAAVTADYGGDAADAGSLKVGGSVTGTLTNVNQQDWFAVALTANQAYEFTVTGYASLLIGTASDVAAEETPVVSDPTFAEGGGAFSSTSEAYYMPAVSGTYYVDVSEPAGSAPDSYTLSVATTTADYSDNPSHAGSLTVGGSISGVLTNEGQDDWFAVALIANQAYEFSVTGGASLIIGNADNLVGAPTSLFFPGTGNVAFSDPGPFSNSASGTQYAYFMPATNGTYYVDVANYDAPVSDNFTLGVTAVTPDYTDNPARPGSLTVGGSATGQLANIGQDDWFAVTLVANQAYEFTATGGTSVAIGTVSELTSLLFGNGTLAYSTSLQDETANSGTSYAYFMPTSTGTYYVDVSDTYDEFADGEPFIAAPFPDSFTVSAAATTADYTDNPTHAGSLTVGGSVSGELTNIGQDDWFSVALTANQAYEFTVKGGAYLTVGTAGELLEGNGAAALSVPSTDTGNTNTSAPANVYFMPTSSGDYYVDVSDDSISEGSTYYPGNTPGLFYTSLPDNFTLSVVATTADYADNAARPGTLTVSPTQAQLTTTSDFNGDGMSDVLWQNDDAQDSGSGQAAIWLMDGVNPTAEDIIAAVPTSWHVVGTGDFYGTGDADILWQNDDGQAAIWEMNGTTPTAETVFASPPPSWHMVATGDFNGDGMSDVLWQYEDTANSSDSQNGNVAIWEMNGASPIATAVVAQPGPDWDVIGTGDFNGDGKSDILWQYEDSQNASDPQNGNVAIWEMNGLTPIAEAVVAQPGPDWHVVGMGDFNGDGKADILWQYEDTANSSDPQNGNVAMWLMNGTTPTASAVVAEPGSAWHAIGSGDYDGSGRSDILWQNTDGQAAIWLMNGLTPTTESVFAAPPSSWHVIPA